MTDIIQKIQGILGPKVKFEAAPAYDPINGLMACKKGEAKYLLENGQIAGLNLSDLGLTDVQWEEIEGLIQPSSVKMLNLGGNLLSKFEHPKGFSSLQSLDLSENKIGDIAFVGHLPELDFLDYNGNPIENPAPEILTQGIEAVRRHFMRLIEAEKEDEVDYLYEAKVLLTGRTGAGKTSLRYKLRHPDETMPAENESTRGIDVEPLEFELPDGRKFRMNIWDFEGQQISHQTHQFFLTKRSLYVFVADQRTEKSDFEYWFQIVELLGEKSPMMIFQNERKAPGENTGLICGINLDGLRQRFGAFLCEGEHRANLDLVAIGERHDPVQFKLFEAFRLELQDRLKNLPIVGTKLKRSWVKIREELEQKAIHDAHIPISTFKDICKKNGIDDTQEQQDLSQLFHDLGIFLHFQSAEQETLLSRIVILQNEWATKAVYQVLKTEWLREQKKGQFVLSDLRKVWAGTDFAEHAGELLELMMRFEICYEVAGTKVFIAPQLLPPSPPSDHRFEESKEMVEMRYQYDFMPKGLLTRLTVRMHPLIARKQTLAWKDGFVAEQGNASAEVVETYGLREIRIKVNGQHCRKLLNVIRYEIDRLNSTYHFNERSQVNELLPCICPMCSEDSNKHFFKYKEVQNWKRTGWNQVPCGISGNPVEVDALLENILENDEQRILDRKKITGELSAIRQSQTSMNQKLDDHSEMLKNTMWLTKESRKDLSQIFEMVEQASQKQEAQLQQLLPQLEDSLQKILPQLPPESAVAKGTKDAIEELKVKGDLKSKFKLAIHLIPGILAFETEIATDPRDLFKKIWHDLRSGKLFLED